MRVPRRTRVRMAAGIWHAVGTLLLVWGVVFIRRAQAAGESALAISLAVGVIVGVAKGIFVLQKAARRTIARVERLPDTSGPLSMFHPAFWLIIPGMMGLGITLRHLAASGHLAYGLVAAIYLGVSAALHLGTRPYWSYEAQPARSRPRSPVRSGRRSDRPKPPTPPAGDREVHAAWSVSAVASRYITCTPRASASSGNE